MDFLIDVANAVLEVSGIKEKVGRSEQMIRLKRRFKLDDIESLKKFEDVYAYALVEYAFDVDGQCKPGELIAFFKLKEVREVFQAAYRENNPGVWLNKGQAIARYKLGDQLPQLDPQRELGTFAAVFFEVVNQTRSPKEIRQEQKLDSLARSLQTIQTQIQQLPSLEAINQRVNQLAGAETLSLPAAAQMSNAMDLAHRLGEWFEVLEYERDPDYEVWATNHFEWAIDFPVTRRRFSRTLVRGVAGEVDMADLQDFGRAIAAANADEGWLVGNRRVSKAARRAVQEEATYADISCYTFDELLDEDADFSKYLDWLETEIKAKGVDVGYLPLACRKDDLDPVSQRKIGVSTYGEEDGWIDGYVDMWLDDPAKEHLSVLGEFGTGKTWFALHYAWVALQRYREAKRRGTERPRIPVVVPLRDYAKAVTVESLFSEFFFRKHEILKNYSVFEQLNRMGKLLLIFDGFDEMAARVDRQSMIDNFWELAKVVVPGAKAILTCRTEHFPDAMQGRQLLSAELESSTANLTGETPQFEVLDLEKFDNEQIATLLKQKASEVTVQMVMENSQLLDLARRPVMVELILEALPDIEAGKPVDMARVYLYAVTKKMERDISNERTFTSMADKLYFLCELSWEMLSTNQMSLNYRAFPERLQQMFSDRVKEEKELDHWRYDMMGQTMLIRNSEGDYSPAHRSLLEFFVAYKIVASLGVMAEDFIAVSQQQLYLDEALPSQEYTWDGYFRRECDNKGVPVKIAWLSDFIAAEFDELFLLLGRAKLAKAVLDLAHPMLAEKGIVKKLLPLLQATASKMMKEVGYLGGNVAQLMLTKTPHALMNADLQGVKVKGVNFDNTYLRRINLQGVQFSEATFPKILGSIGSVAYSPCGTHIAIGDRTGSVQILDLATEKVVSFCLGHTSGISSIAYSPDGKQLASGSFDLTVKLWNPETGKCIRTLTDHCNWVRSVVYSPGGKQLASGSDDKTVKLWDTKSGNCIHTLNGHEERVRTVAFNYDGKQLASGSDDSTIRIWSTTSGQCINILKSHSSWVRAVAYSPDGKQLASGSYDQSVKLWNPISGNCLHTLKGYIDGLRSLTYSPDGQQLATGSYDKVLKIWTTNSYSCTHNLKGHDSWIRSVVYSPDGQQLATGSDDKTVKLWNPETGECVRTLGGYENGVRSVVYRSDGKQLASGNYDKTVKLWNTETGECIQTLEGHESWVWSVVYHPNSKQLASSSSDKTVKLWNLETGECSRTLEGHEDWVLSVVYSPDGQRLATSSSDKTVKLWNTETGECIQTLEGHESWVRSVMYHPNGQQLATSSSDTTVKLWNTETGECIKTLEGHKKGVRSVIYSPNGQQLVTGSSDKTVKLWNTETGECIQTLEGHKNGVRSMVYRPDGRQIATGSYDTSVKLWNPETGECIRTLQGHENWVYSVVYSSDSQQLASGSYDNTIRIWDVNTGECLRVIGDHVCEGLNITGTIGLSPGQRTALKLMGAVDHGEEG
ncbi:MAG: pentapeptide repeat-containing protein [Phormidesmis sp.]